MIVAEFLNKHKQLQFLAQDYKRKLKAYKSALQQSATSANFSEGLL